MNGSTGFTRPRDTQLRLSAHTNIGGSTTSALSNATPTFMATMRPKSRSSGSDENDSTATPAMAVSPDTMNARPVRDAATSTASFGSSPRRRSSMNRNRISDVNSVHAAMTSGPPTAVIGLSLRLRPYATSDADPTAMSTGTNDSSERTTDRSRTARKRNTKRIAR